MWISSLPPRSNHLSSTANILNSVTSDDNSGDIRESDIVTSHKNPTSKKYPVLLPYIQGVSEQIRRVFKQYDIPAKLQAYEHAMSVIGKTEGQNLEGTMGAVTTFSLSGTMC